MSELEKVIAEDLKASVIAFKDDSFDNVNVFGNRIMSNAIFGENKKIFLPGFFLKDVGFAFGLLKVRKSPMAFSTAKAHGFSYVESLEKALESFDEEQLWKSYQEYSDKIRKFETSEWEEKTYSNNVKFTNDAFKWLLSYLNTHKEVLSEPLNNLIKGITNEMNRVYRVHSANLRDLIILRLMVALERNYEYACRYWNDTRIINEKKIQTIIIPAIDKIVSLGSKEFSIEEADSVLWNLVKTWREFFIKYGELISPTVAVQRGIELPDALKKKLTEDLTKTLEKEI